MHKCCRLCLNETYGTPNALFIRKSDFHIRQKQIANFYNLHAFEIYIYIYIYIFVEMRKKKRFRVKFCEQNICDIL